MIKEAPFTPYAIFPTGGGLGFGNTSDQFSGCANLTISATDKPDLSGTTSLMYAFANCNSLTEIPGINSWEISEVTESPVYSLWLVYK